MPLGTFIAGRYSSTLNSVDLGLAEDGYEVSYEPKQTPINRSDHFGDTLLDTIYRGGDWSMAALFMEYKTGTKNAISQLTGGTLGVLDTIGRLGSNIAQSLVLTSTAATPAAAEPATLTALKCLLAPNANPRLLFNSELRKVPLRFNFLLYDAGGSVYKHFTQT